MSDYRAELERRIAALDSMMQSEGWQLMRSTLEASEQAIYAEMQKCQASEVAKHFGAYNAVRDLKTWPERERTVMVHQLRAVGNGSTNQKR